MSKMFNSGGISVNPSTGSFKAWGWGLAIVVLGGLLVLGYIFRDLIITIVFLILGIALLACIVYLVANYFQ